MKKILIALTLALTLATFAYAAEPAKAPATAAPAAATAAEGPLRITPHFRCICCISFGAFRRRWMVLTGGLQR